MKEGMRRETATAVIERDAAREQIQKSGKGD